MPFAPVATLGNGSGGQLTALVIAPHGTLGLGPSISARGAFSAFAVNVGTGAHITYQTGITVRSGPPVNVVPGNTIPAAVATSPIVSALPQSTVVSIGLELPFQNTPALVALLGNLYNPLSSQYHQFLTPAAFNAQFESASNYTALTSWATAVGLNTTTFTNTRFLIVRGTVAQLGVVFGVNFYNYNSTSNGQFYAPDRIPTVSSAIPALFEGTGFNSFNKAPAPPPTNQNPAQATGSGPNGTFLASDIRSLYAGGTTLDGTGQSLALVEFDDYVTTDIGLYMNSTVPPLGSITATKPERVRVMGGVPAVGLNQNEVTLDIEVALAMAPNLANLVVFEGPPLSDARGNLTSNDASSAAVYNAIETFIIPGTNGNVIQQVSSSYLMFDGQAVVQSLTAMATQGQSVFIASGDMGAYVNTNQILSTLLFPPTPFGPFNSPGLMQGGLGQTCMGGNPFQCITAANLLTIVGGTQSGSVSGSNTACMNEVVWNDGTQDACLMTPGCFNHGPSGGGVCPSVSIPPWQPPSLMTSSNNGSTTFRNIPDVAALADQIFIVLNGTTASAGGTSASAPIWAGFLALTNQLRASPTGLGLLTQLLYPLAQNSNYSTVLFHDITVGTNNPNPSDPTHFSAVTGYDLATGLGTPRMGLIGQLAGGAIVPIEIFNTVTLQVGTGDDDLKSASQVLLQLLDAHGGFLDQVILHDFGAPSWSNNTTVSVGPQSLTLSLHLSDLAFVHVILNQGSCGGCTSDNWDMSSLTVQLNGTGPSVIVFAEDPFPTQVRLKDNGSGTWPFVFRPTDNTTACPTTCFNNHACGVASDCASGGTCIGGSGVSGSNTGCCEEPSTLCQTNADCPANTTCQFLGNPAGSGACL